MPASLFLLKTAPPRLGRTLPARPRLDRIWSEVSDRSAIVVTAPQGFGKTTLLAVLGFSDVALGLTHVWEGNPVKAGEVLRPRLETVERETGRRSVVAALADRLDVFERAGMPDALILAYRVLDEGAWRSGDERRAHRVPRSPRPGTYRAGVRRSGTSVRGNRARSR
jgi:hypothetical protein